MARGYIELINSTGSLSKRFVVQMEGYSEELEKAGDLQKTIGGGIDYTVGGVYEMYVFIMKVPHTVTDSNYGTINDLKTFFSYNNPNGSPTNVITLRDHLYDETSVSKSVFLVGKLQTSPLTIVASGSESYRLMKISMIVIPA